MRSLRVWFVVAGMLLLPAATLSAQAGTVPCKDGSRANGGHFSCWGHGGIGTAVVKPAPKTDAKPVARTEKKNEVSRAKPVARKHAPASAKADKRKGAGKKAARKAHAKKASKHGRK
jgi:hypothetical protein